MDAPSRGSCTPKIPRTLANGELTMYKTVPIHDSLENATNEYLRKLFKNPRAKPDGTKMFCSAFLNDARMCCFFANAIVKY